MLQPGDQARYNHNALLANHTCPTLRAHYVRTMQWHFEPMA